MELYTNKNKLEHWQGLFCFRTFFNVLFVPDCLDNTILYCASGLSFNYYNIFHVLCILDCHNLIKAYHSLNIIKIITMTE